MANGKPMLTGYRVLDITQYVAGPACCRMLAEMGAEVIKVELAPDGDRTRTMGFKPADPALADVTQSTYFFQQNHSKKSLALDFSKPRARELIRSLIPRIDVVVENFTPGVMARAGLGYEDLRKINPALIMCSISLAGQSGPLSGKPGYDYIGSAYAGVSDLLGEPGRAPAHQGTSIGDSLCGMSATAAILAALLHREHTGEGQYIDAALIDNYFNTHQNSIPRIALQRGQFVPKRSGRFHPEGGGGAYRYRDDQWIYLIAPDHKWVALTRALNAPEWLDDPRFRTRRERRLNGEESRRRDRGAAEPLLQPRGGSRGAGAGTGTGGADPDSERDGGTSPSAPARHRAQGQGPLHRRVRHPWDAGQNVRLAAAA